MRDLRGEAAAASARWRPRARALRKLLDLRDRSEAADAGGRGDRHQRHPRLPDRDDRPRQPTTACRTDMAVIAPAGVVGRVVIMPSGRAAEGAAARRPQRRGRRAGRAVARAGHRDGHRRERCCTSTTVGTTADVQTATW